MEFVPKMDFERVCDLLREHRMGDVRLHPRLEFFSGKTPLAAGQPPIPGPTPG